MAESVRGGIISVDPRPNRRGKGHRHESCPNNALRHFAAGPLRNILPQIGNNFIINVKDTSIMFIISFTEFFAVHRAVVGATYLYFPSAVIEMGGYLLMTLTASFLLRWLERKMDGPENFDLAAADPLVPGEGMHRYKKNPKEPNADYRRKEQEDSADLAAKAAQNRNAGKGARE